MVSKQNARDAILSIESVNSISHISYVDAGINDIFNAKVNWENSKKEIYVKFRDVAPKDSFRAAPIASEYVRHNTSVSTPKTVYMDWTNNIVDPDWYVMEAAETTNTLQNTKLNKSDRLEALRTSGEELGKLHRDSVATGYGDFRVSESGEMFYDGDDWGSWVADLAERTYEKRESDFFESEYPIISEAIETIPNVVPQNPPSKVLHADYWPANFFFEKNYSAITSVIDWDWVLGGDQFFDLAIAEYLCTNHLDETEVEAFRDGYTNSTSIEMDSPVFNSKRYDAYRLTISFREMIAFNHWYKSYSDEETKNAAEWVIDYAKSTSECILNDDS